MTIIVVPINESHIESFHAALDVVSREKKYLSFLEAPSIESTRDFIAEKMAKNFPHYVALDGEKVVGWCDIWPSSETIQLHCGTLGMGILPEYRGQGIGKKLISSTINQAKKIGIERVELTVYTSNYKAVSLYLNQGFLVEGTKKKSAKINGEYIDQYIMALIF